MKIESIYIASFGKLRNIKIDFGSRVNIIRGENEAGKSTVCNFIRFIFYGLPGRADEKQRFISWETATAGGYAVIENDDGVRYRIERDVVCASSADGKTTYRERSAIIDIATSAQCFRGENAGDVFFGVPADVFESTVYIGQIGESKVGGRSLAEATENILFSGSESVNAKKALKKLDDARVFLMYKNRRGGKIYELSQRKEELAARLEKAQAESGEVINLQGTCRTLREKLEAEKRRHSDCEAKLATCEKYAARQLWLDRRAEEERRREFRSRRDELLSAKKYNGIRVFDDEYIGSLEALSRNIDTTSARHDAARQASDQAARKVADMKEKIDVFKKFGRSPEQRADVTKKIRESRAAENSSRAKAVIAAVPALLTAIVGIANLFSGFLPEILTWIFISIAGISAVGSILFFILSKQNASDVREKCAAFGCSSYKEFEQLCAAVDRDAPVLSYIEEERTKAAEAEKTAAEQLDSANSRAYRTLQAAGFEIEDNTRASLQKALAVCRNEKSALEKAELALAGQSKLVADMDSRLRAYDEQYLREAISAEYDEEAMRSSDMKAIKRDLEFLTGSISMMTQKLADDEKTLAVLLATTQRPTEISEELDAVTHELDVLSEKFDAYILAIESIESASGKLRDAISPKIAATAGTLMERLSLGKYDKLGVDNDFGVTFTDKSLTHAADSLSAGTGDLVYISLRLALTDILYTNSKPPLIFDESFSRTDDGRLDAALRLVREYCDSGSQSLVFTCHGREENAMKTVGEYALVTLKR